MPTQKNFLWIVFPIAFVVLGALLYWWLIPSPSPSAPRSSATPTPRSTPLASVTYSCDKGRTIHAAFYENGAPVPPQPGQPPVPTGSVEVSLDDGPTFTLAQTISASGTRYSDGDPQILQGQPGAESFVFWSKGDTALIMRNNVMDLEYANCVAKESK